MKNRISLGVMFSLPVAAFFLLQKLFGDAWLALYNANGVTALEQHWLQRTAIASDFVAAVFVLGVFLVLYRKRCYERLPVVVPIVITVAALLVMLVDEGRRLWPYLGQYEFFDLLQYADLVIVISLIAGTMLTIVSAASPAGLGRKRIPFWTQGTIERAKSGNFGTADWMSLSCGAQLTTDLSLFDMLVAVR